MWLSIATVAPVDDVLLVPDDRVLWAIAIGVGLFGLAGVWLARHDAREERRSILPDGAARKPDDTRPE